MKHLFLMLVLLSMGCKKLKAQYYFDRSKNPDKSVVQPKQSSGGDYGHFFFLSWDGNTPMSNPGYITQPSSLGLKLGFRKRLNDVDRLWAGADLGWAYYKQYVPYQTYTYGSQSISTDLYNYSYNYSLTANIDYFFFPMEKLVTPYAGFGIGVAYDKFSQYYNIYGQTTSSFGLQLRPEAGVLVGFKENSPWRIKVAFHYDYASNTSNLVSNNFITPGNNDNYKSFLNYGFQIGVVKMVW